jgi:hypothetical protein
MAHPLGYGRNHPCLDRPRENGRFTPDPSKPPKRKRENRPKQHTPKSLLLIQKLYDVTMCVANVIQQMMTPPEAEADDSAQQEDGKPQKAKPEKAKAEKAKPKPPRLPPDYARVIRPNDGVVDGLDTLVQLVIRLHDKEREIGVLSETDDERDSQALEDDLDQRIAEELDRIAARSRAAGGAG